MTKHILFLTGALAEQSLRRTLKSMEPVDFTYQVHNLGLSVAALMTADMIKRRLTDTLGAECIIVPGLCGGNVEEASHHLKVPIVRGPEDLKELPEFFGRGGVAPDLSRCDVRIFAEIVDAPHLDSEGILKRAERYRTAGADVIDLGCLPGTPFSHLEEAVVALREAGFQVSVDSLEPDELLRAGRAGAHYLLSLKESTLWLADEVEAIPILIPEEHGDLRSLTRAIDAMVRRGRSFIADSILDPIHFGFTESILRYHELRRCFPEVEILMGTGNLTELTDADTTGITATLLGIASELKITNVLVTQVSPHARCVVRETDVARRIMYAAREALALPRGLDFGLLTTHERKPFLYSPEEIAETAAAVRDPSFRVQVSEAGLHIFNRDGLHTVTDPFDAFPHLKLENDGSHAFYMGVELARAEIAWQLGKRYSQDQALKWGCAVDILEPDPTQGYKEPGTTLAHRKTKRA
jgi:Dihydropteroate synthase and related enzymes